MIFRWLNRGAGHLSRQELSAYIDGGPGAPSEARVQAHLAECDGSCGADIDELRTTVAILRSVAPVKTPRSFAITPAMVADLPDGKPLGSPPPVERHVSGTRIPLYAPAIAAAAAAVVFALVLVGDLAGAIEQNGRGGPARAAPGAVAAAPLVSERASAIEPAQAAAPPTGAASPEGPASGESSVAAEALPQLSVAAGEAESAAMVTGADSAPPPAPDVAAKAAQVAPDAQSLAPSAALTAPEARSLAPDQTAAPEPEALIESAQAAAPGNVPRPAGEIVQEATFSEPEIATSPDSGDEIDLPVWQILLGTGLAALLLGLAALAAARRDRA